ncbi:hypothetical protein Tco_0356958 [Tanacetum coccineum]
MIQSGGHQSYSNGTTESDHHSKLPDYQFGSPSRERVKYKWRDYVCKTLGEGTAYPNAYAALEAIADEPQNINHKLRGQLILLEDPYRGSTDDKIEESFRAKHPGLSSGVLPAIKFTHTFVSEMCKDAALAKELRDLSLCSAIPIPGYYKNNRKKYGMRKIKTHYKGKAAFSHCEAIQEKITKSIETSEEMQMFHLWKGRTFCKCLRSKTTEKLQDQLFIQEFGS